MTDAPSPQAVSDEKLGRFGHHPDPAIDFCVEVECIEGMTYDAEAGLQDAAEVKQRAALAMTFRVGGDPGAVVAKDILRRCEDRLNRLAASPALAAPSGGEAVAYCDPAHLARIQGDENERATIYSRPGGTYRTPLYAAPPAAGGGLDRLEYLRKSRDGHAANAHAEFQKRVMVTDALIAAREALHQHYVDWDGEPEDAVALQEARAECDRVLDALTATEAKPEGEGRGGWIDAKSRGDGRGDLWLALDANGKLFPGLFVNHRIPADATLVQRIILPADNTPSPDADRVRIAKVALEGIRLQSEDCLGVRMETITSIADHALAALKGEA